MQVISFFVVSFTGDSRKIPNPLVSHQLSLWLNICHGLVNNLPLYYENWSYLSYKHKFWMLRCSLSSCNWISTMLWSLHHGRSWSRKSMVTLNDWLRHNLKCSSKWQIRLQLKLQDFPVIYSEVVWYCGEKYNGTQYWVIGCWIGLLLFMLVKFLRDIPATWL